MKKIKVARKTILVHKRAALRFFPRRRFVSLRHCKETLNKSLASNSVMQMKYLLTVKKWQIKNY